MSIHQVNLTSTLLTQWLVLNPVTACMVVCLIGQVYPGEIHTIISFQYCHQRRQLFFCIRTDIWFWLSIISLSTEKGRICLKIS